MGGSSLAWNYQHVVGHHQHTNVFKADPDLPILQKGDVRRIFRYQSWTWVYRYQAYYLPFLYTLFGFKTRIYDMMMIYGYKQNGNIEMNIDMKDRILLLVTKLFWIGYQFFIPYYYFQLPLSSVIATYAMADWTTGAWLAYFFQVNHISDSLEYTDQEVEKSTVKKEWAELQLEGTVDYAHDSPLFAFLSGTLNFQSVHHLFPSVGPHHYPALAPIVRQAAKDHNIRYHLLPSFARAAWNHFKELDKMGRKLVM